MSRSYEELMEHTSAFRADRFGMFIHWGLYAVSYTHLDVYKRQEKGSFVSFRDFLERMSGGDVNKRVVESLIRCGAFDCFGARRAQMLAVFEPWMDEIANDRRVNIEGQLSLFGEAEQKQDTFPPVEEFARQELLAMEMCIRDSIRTV